MRFFSLLPIVVPVLLTAQSVPTLESLDQRLTVLERKPSAEQVATLRWFPARAGIALGTPHQMNRGLAFDGDHIWVGHAGAGRVSKYRASDGALLGTFAGGSRPWELAFDGAHIWTSNSATNSVTKVRASDGAMVVDVPLPFEPGFLTFDGTHLWVAELSHDRVTRVRVSDGAVLGGFSAGQNPNAMLFDGTSLWVGGEAGITKRRPSDGATLLSLSQPVASMVFDGSHIWAVNSQSGMLLKLRASDGALMGSLHSGSPNARLTFDGVHVWVANGGTGLIVRAVDAGIAGTFNAAGIYNLLSDGVNVWATHAGVNSLIKF
jgi:hypothetical protein